MLRGQTPILIACILTAVATTSIHAQFVVHDPINYTQALLRYSQMLQQYRFWLTQARRLPVDMATRYRVLGSKWRHHDVEVQYPYARPLLTALNFGDTSGALYGEVSDRLEDLDHTQAALLNKINGASVLELRISETTNQFLMHMLEQLLVQNKRTRDAEAQLMDAHLFQWRYGTPYGRDLFSRTASSLDTWRQP